MNVYVGLDVGSRSVAMAWRQKGHTAGTWDIEQTPKGHALATKKLLKLKPVCVVMEATGIYYLDLAIALSNAGLPVSVINPKSFHNFAKLTLTNSKTDGIDAQLLAEFGERMTPRLWVAPTADHLATLPRTLKSAQVSRHAGLDVRLTQSGSSVDKPGRMSKAGNGYLRAATFCLR